MRDDVSITVNYAPYIDEPLGVLLTQSRHRTAQLIPELADGMSYDLTTPYDNYEGLDVNQAVFGAGYLIENFPSLYDMFGKFMAGFDVEVPWGRLFGRIVSREEVDNAVAEDIRQADDNMVKGEMAEYQTGMRSINAVVSSSFIMGKAAMERRRIFALARLSLEKKAELLSMVGTEFSSSLNWAKKIVTGYSELMQDYYLGKTDLDGANYDSSEKKSLWPFYVFDFHKANIGAMQSAKSFKYMPERERSRSDLSKWLLVASYTAQGAQIGGQIGGPWGAVIGALVGFSVGIAAVFIFPDFFESIGMPSGNL